MGYEQRFVWKCDVCGWTWIPRKDGKEPESCPNRKCRSRKWNAESLKAAKAKVLDRLSARLDVIRAESPAVKPKSGLEAQMLTDGEEAFKLALREKFKNFVKNPAGV